MPNPPSDFSTETSQNEALVPATPRNGADLLLAFAKGSFLGEERISIPREGVVLGRGSEVFHATRLDDPQLSRRHVELRCERGRVVLCDLKSRNRTFVNGREAVGNVSLAFGDVVRLGSTLFVVCAPRPEQAPPLDRELVGESAAMWRARRAVEAVAGHENTVLVTGETGVGKEVVASAIHRQSRRPGAFIAINCGALMESVLASELFGHVRGAFTGATSARAGMFRAAERGTLFLDEIGEMPPSLQAKMLRALETRSVRPVGAEHESPVDVRVIAATGRDLVSEVLRGTFRSDLYARLAQWSIHVLPLRARREDVPLLARHLLARHEAAGRPIDPALAERLMLHDWPLNVRGLANVLSIAVVAAGREAPLARTPEVDDALLAELRLTEAPSPNPTSTPAPEGGPRAPSTEELEAALRRHRGNVAEAARHLGCSRQHLYRWLGAAGVDPTRFRAGSPRDE